MSANLVRKLGDKIPLPVLRFLGNMWVPFLGMGIRILVVREDYKFIRVRLNRSWYNSNYVGTQFGGAIYAMTDPFYMLMLINILGNGYIVWDKAASIRFKKPGRSDLFAEFALLDSEIEEIQQKLLRAEKMDWKKTVLVTDSDGTVIAEVEKTVNIRRKAAQNS